jgi:hypothetical protein
MFIELLKNASKIICLDADLCDMNMKFLFEVLSTTDHVMIYNQYKNRRGITCKFFESDNRLKLLLFEHIRNLKYFVACFDSKRYLLDLQDEIMSFIRDNQIVDEDGNSIEHKIKIYANGIGEDMIDTREWENAFVLYTPKVIYGVSYTYSQKDVFCFATKDTLNALHINQQIQRCRDQSNLFIYAHDNTYVRKYKNIDDVSECTNKLVDNYVINTQELREINQKCKILDPHNECRFYRIIYDYVLYANDILRSHTKEYLIQILSRYGYTIEYLHEEEFEGHEEDMYIEDPDDNKSFVSGDSDKIYKEMGDKIETHSMISSHRSGSSIATVTTVVSDISSLTFCSGGSQSPSFDEYIQFFQNSSDYSKSQLLKKMGKIEMNKEKVKKKLKKITEIIPENVPVVDKEKERRDKIIEMFKIDVDQCNELESKMLENNSYVEYHLNFRNLIKSDDKFDETVIQHEFKELIEERVNHKLNKIKYARRFMKELGIMKIEDIKFGNVSKYKNKIESKWILENFEFMKDKLFELRGEKYDKDLLSKEGGYIICYTMMIHMIKNLCGGFLIESKRFRIDKNNPNIRVGDYNLSKEYYELNCEIMNKKEKSKDDNKVCLFVEV